MQRRFVTEEELKAAIQLRRKSDGPEPISIPRDFNVGQATPEQIEKIKSRDYKILGRGLDTTGWDLDDSGNLIRTSD